MKILYLMHINWHWIRQRPQAVAGLLAQRHEMHFMHYAMYRRSHRANEAPAPGPARVLARLPGRLKRAWSGFARLDQAWIARQVAAEARRFAPDLVWVTHPDFAAAVRACGVARVVYDCMDDPLAFDAGGATELARAEQRLIQSAELTIFSSATLAERVTRRAPPRRQLVVNNGVDERLCSRPAPPAPAQAGGRFTLGYFGTLSHWFDWSLILQLLDALPTVELRLAGPVEATLPSHPRVHHVGILEHGQLAAFAAECHALVMPFVLSPLTEAVDPVKLYEYIAFGRPALAPRYRESERFEPLVTLYRDHAEAIAQVRHWAAPGTLSAPAMGPAQVFLQANTWQRRGTQILAALG